MQRMTLTRMIASTFGLDESTAFIITAILAVAVFLGVAVPSLRQWLKKTDDAGKKRAVRRVVIAVTAVMIAALAGYAVIRVIPQHRAEKAMEEGNYQQAADLYHRLGMLTEEIAARKQLGEAAAADGNYEEAIRIFDGLNVQQRVKELRAEKALLDLQTGETEQTLDELARLLDQPPIASALLQDAALRSAVLAPGREVPLGESVWDETSWYIAAAEEEKVLLLCTSVDESKFHTDAAMSWRDSDIRAELQLFFEEKVPEAVRSAALVTRNQNLDSDGMHVSVGETTEDRLFIPSAEEVQQYLPVLASALNGERFWTRTPIEDEHCGQYAAELIQQEDGTVEVGLVNSAWTVKNNGFPLMWVDVNALLQTWAAAE